MTGTSLVEQRPADPAVVQVGVLLVQAEEYRLAGDYRAGSGLARQAARLAAASGNPQGQARALRSLANQLLRLGDQEDAVAACRDAVAALETVGDEAGICDVLTLQAMPLNELGMHTEALDVLARGRDIAQRLGDRDLLYWVHNRTGVVHGSMGDRDLSTEYLMRALTMVDGMDVEARFCILNNVSDNAIYQVARLRAEGEPDRAEETLRGALGLVAEALGLARAAGNPFRESICLDNFGMLLALAGDFTEAARLIEDSRAIAVIHGYRSLESAALQHQAHVRLMLGDCAAAIEGLLEALDRAGAAGEKPMAMEINRELSEAYERLGDFAAALGHYRSFHALEREAHNQVAAARARMAVHGFELDNARLETDNARLESELHRVRSVELEAANLSWQRQASEDALTGLPNRRFVELRLPELAALPGPLCVAIADVDLFKGVNDRFGHFVGDEVLQQIAAILRDNVRDNDLVARFGGEEFLIALDGLSLADAQARCELLRAQVAGYPWDRVQAGLAVTISLGVAVVPAGGDLPAAMTLADQRLYDAKRDGRNRVGAGGPGCSAV
jgi:diguanylate cyclase (GGDEF)-like protein